MFLEKIVESKRIEVEQSKRQIPLSKLENAIRHLPATRNFKTALAKSRCALIAEVKRSSPSKGILREDFDFREIASLYAANGASAISVLTDEKYFGGHKRYLSEIHKLVELPLLRKDFIVDPYQVYETRAIGGDAILLIAALMDEKQLCENIKLSEQLEVDSLVEVHSHKELEAALQAGAGMIGINNRNLNTFETDIKTTIELTRLVPPGITVISESGISNRNDIEILLEVGVHGFLIGEALMRSQEIGVKLKELLGK